MGPWSTRDNTHFAAANNTAAINVEGPRSEGGVSPRGGPDAGAMSRAAESVATIFARMGSGKYRQLVISAQLQAVLEEPRCKELLELVEQCCDPRHRGLRATVPAFMQGRDAKELIKRHRHRRGLTAELAPEDRPTLLSVMCGIGGGVAAWIAAGILECNVTLVTCCPEDVEVLRKLYPTATVIQGDVRDPVLRQIVVDKCAGVTVALVALLCQPSSEASTVHKLDDERNATGLAACSLALACGPSVFCGENVASFKKRQRPTFDTLVKTLAAQFGRGQVSVVYLNAFHCMVPQPRNRVWIIAVAEGIDINPLLTSVRKQKKLCLSGVATCPTLREELSHHRPGMRRMDGLFIPSLRGCPLDRGRARRVISTDQPSAEGGTMYDV